MSTLIGIGLCALLFALFVGFVRPKAGGCSGTGSCGTCQGDGHCSNPEFDNEH